jgi:hypothetical protein
MIRLSPVEIAQGAGAALAIVGLLMLLPLGAVCLIVGLVVLCVSTFAELQGHKRPPRSPAPTSPTDGS